MAECKGRLTSDITGKGKIAFLNPDGSKSNKYYYNILFCKKECLRGSDLCGYTKSGVKCDQCPSFCKWSKKKQNKFLLKTALSINSENFKETQDFSDPISSIKLESSVIKFHKFICQFLNPKMINFYGLIYIENLKDEQVIERLKNINGKGITKRQLITIRKNLQIIAKKKISEFDPEE